jgi:hypothetical protein
VNYNPYAAPQAAPPQPGGPPQAGQPQAWSVGSVLGAGWDLFKIHWIVFFFGTFIAWVSTAIVSNIVSRFGGPLTNPYDIDQLVRLEGYAILGSFVGQFVQAFFETGIIRVSLMALRGQQVEFGTLFSGFDRYLPMLVARLLCTLAIMLGSLFFIVPGIILMCVLSLTGYFIVDRNMGAIEAMKASAEATRGHRISIFVFGLAWLGITIAGACACGFGMFASLGILNIALALIYGSITGMVSPPNTAYGPPMGGPPYGPPPPGFGPPPGGGFGAPPGYGPPPGGGGYGPPPGFGPPPTR